MNVGDTVYWEGNYFLKCKPDDAGFETEFLSGENEIIEIGEKLENFPWGRVMVKLDNGKLFDINTVKLVAKHETTQEKKIDSKGISED